MQAMQGRLHRPTGMGPSHAPRNKPQRVATSPRNARRDRKPSGVAEGSNRNPTSLPAAGVSSSTTSSPGSANSSSNGSSSSHLMHLKTRLLIELLSLDRGLAANAKQQARAVSLADELEVAGSRSENWVVGTPAFEDMLAGTWRLVYSSGFASGSLGGRRPGPPAAFFPVTLGQVYQVIDIASAKLDNVVELLLPSLPTKLPSRSTANASSPPADTPAVRLTLRHEYEVLDHKTVKIVFEETSGQLTGSSMFDSWPTFQFPQLPEIIRPSKSLRSGTFNVTYLDDSLRITRGDRGELRIFVRGSRME